MSRSVFVATVVAGAALGSTATLAAPPEPVSPAGVVEARCPTFSWSAVAGAAGYELVVYAVAEGGEVGEEPLLTAQLPGGASSWTPSGGGCLAAGDRFAWSLRVRGDERSEGWSAPTLFEVAAAPSVSEVEAALATLRRYLAEDREGGAEDPEAAGRSAAGGPPAGTSRARSTGQPRIPRRPRARGSASGAGGSPGALAPAAAPALGTPSLTLDANVALGAASNLFKDGAVFLWDDTLGNTGLGRSALASADGDASANTAVGAEALASTVAGPETFHGSRNTAVGNRALADNTTGWSNTALGRKALESNVDGSLNTAVGSGALYSNIGSSAGGHRNTATGASALDSNSFGSFNTATGVFALRNNTTGDNNTAIGYKALHQATGDTSVAIGFHAGLHATDGDDNVFIANSGEAADNGTIRIGTEGTHNRAFIAGIHGESVDEGTDLTVLVDETGKLGAPVSSRRFKEGIADLGAASERLLELRPVRFRYRSQEGEGPERYGLVAEEVAEVFPELVVDDSEGEPYTVRYHVLVPLLLNELQRVHGQLERATEAREAQGAELEALHRRLAALEGVGEDPRLRRCTRPRKPGGGGVAMNDPR